MKNWLGLLLFFLLPFLDFPHLNAQERAIRIGFPSIAFQELPLVELKLQNEIPANTVMDLSIIKEVQRELGSSKSP